MDFTKRYTLKGEKHGQVISERLSHLLRTYANRDHRIKAANETGVGLSTVNKVVTRAHVLAVSNEAAIVKLVELAIQKCEETLQAKNELTDFLEPENLIE